MQKLKEKLGIKLTFDEIPTPIKTKTGLMILSSVGLLVLMMIMLLTKGFILQEDKLMMSAGMIILAVTLISIAAWIYVTVAAGKYVEIKGLCTNNYLSGNKLTKIYSAAKQHRTILIEGYDGKAYVLYVNAKKKIARVGYPVTIYMSENTKPVLKDGEYHIYNYLAIESTGAKSE